MSLVSLFNMITNDLSTRSFLREFPLTVGPYWSVHFVERLSLKLCNCNFCISNLTLSSIPVLHLSEDDLPHITFLMSPPEFNSCS